MLNSQQLTIKPLIYFREGGNNIYLLVKFFADNNWRLPEFHLNLEDGYKPTINEADAFRIIYQLLEDNFAISKKEVKSLRLEDAKASNQSPLLSIEIKEEAVIVLSDNYRDYTWEDKPSLTA